MFDVLALLDKRPIIVAVAGPNGAGKTTFHNAFLQSTGLRFLNADVLSRALALNPYDAAELAGALRSELVRQRESFVFETVFSDPAGDKLNFLKQAQQSGYTILLCFIWISSFTVSEQRVAMRVSQGGHDVPTEKLVQRFPRTLKNLKAAIKGLRHVRIYDNDDLRDPYRLMAVFENGRATESYSPIPRDLKPFLRKK